MLLLQMTLVTQSKLDSLPTYARLRTIVLMSDLLREI